MTFAADIAETPSAISDELIEEAVSRLDIDARLEGLRRTLFLDVSLPDGAEDVRGQQPGRREVVPAGGRTQSAQPGLRSPAERRARKNGEHVPRGCDDDGAQLHPPRVAVRSTPRGRP